MTQRNQTVVNRFSRKDIAVSIAIIAILGSMLVPVFSKTPSVARAHPNDRKPSLQISLNFGEGQFNPSEGVLYPLLGTVSPDMAPLTEKGRQSRTEGAPDRTR